MNVLLRHACGGSADSERDIETILTEAALGKRRLWVNSILFAELRPSTFVRGPFQTIAEFANYIRAIATFVTPDPNTMLRVARLRDVEWRRPAALRSPGEKPRFMSLVDALQIASALWVKEALAVADLEFLAFDELKSRGCWSRRPATVALAAAGLHGRRAGQFGRPRRPRTDPGRTVSATRDRSGSRCRRTEPSKRRDRLPAIQGLSRRVGDPGLDRRRQDGPDREDRAFDAVVAIIDGQQVLGKIGADEAPAARRRRRASPPARHRRRLRPSPWPRALRSVSSESGRTPTRENSGASPRSRMSRPTRIGKIGAQVGTWPATTIERTPSPMQAPRARRPARRDSRDSASSPRGRIGRNSRRPAERPA